MKKWTDKDMIEFARVSSQGAYGKYEGCRTLESKLKKYETIMNTMTVRITETRQFSKTVEVEVDVPADMPLQDVRDYLHKNQHLYESKLYGLIAKETDKLKSMERKYDVLTFNFGGDL